MDFKYFERPFVLAPVTNQPVACDFCQVKTICFEGSHFLGSDSFNFICGTCLLSGKLTDIDAFCREPDHAELALQAKAAFPEMNRATLERYVDDATYVLTKMTPPLISWQEWNWPSIDGDYGIFLGFGSRALYAKLFDGADTQEFFINSLSFDTQDYGPELWEDRLPKKEINSLDESLRFSTLFYIFKSARTGKIVTRWDEA